MFAEFDADRDGRVGLADVRRILSSLGYHVTTGALKSRFSKLDVNGTPPLIRQLGYRRRAHENRRIVAREMPAAWYAYSVSSNCLLLSGNAITVISGDQI